MIDARRTPGSAPGWMSAWLRAAGLYNMLWGAAVIIAPNLVFELLDADTPRYPQLWQCVGMIVGVYGVGYWIAARDPYRHWPIVLVGLLGKVFGPLGFVFAILTSDFPASFAWIILPNDLVWWIPFGVILYRAFEHHAAGPEAAALPGSLEDAMAHYETTSGRSLLERSRERALLVVFLRHLGCTFCREALSDLADRRERLAEEGVGVVLVHMASEEDAAAFFDRYGLGGAERVSDPERVLYRAFGLQRGRFLQLFGPRVAVRGLRAAIDGHRVGRLVGNGFQMPGVFLVRDGRIERAFRHRTAGDRPDYDELATCPIPG